MGSSYLPFFVALGGWGGGGGALSSNVVEKLGDNTIRNVVELSHAY